jgi:hypothetical protein
MMAELQIATATDTLTWVENDRATYVYTAPPPGQLDRRGMCIAFARCRVTDLRWEIKRTGQDEVVEADNRTDAHAALRLLVGAVAAVDQVVG